MYTDTKPEWSNTPDDSYANAIEQMQEGNVTFTKVLHLLGQLAQYLKYDHDMKLPSEAVIGNFKHDVLGINNEGKRRGKLEDGVAYSLVVGKPDDLTGIWFEPVSDPSRNKEVCDKLITPLLDEWEKVAEQKGKTKIISDIKEIRKIIKKVS